MKEFDEYVAKMTFDGLADRTVWTYKNNITWFLRDNGITKVEQMDNLSEGFFEDYDVRMSYEMHLSPNARSIRLTAVRRFYDWLIKRKYVTIEKNPVTEHVKIKTVRKDSYLTVDQMQSFINACDSKRNKAMFTLLFETGARFSEMANIKIGDIQEKEDPYTKQRFCGAEIIGKGDKKRTLGFTTRCMELIIDYLENEHPDPVPENYLFVSRFNTKLNDSAVNLTMKKIAAMAGIEDPESFHMHSCRHSFASKQAEMGCDPVMLQRMMGHTHLSTTSRYIRYDTERSAACMAEVVPVPTFSRNNQVDLIPAGSAPQIAPMIMQRMQQIEMNKEGGSK